jgi:hypothetical protein
VSAADSFDRFAGGKSAGESDVLREHAGELSGMFALREEGETRMTLTILNPGDPEPPSQHDMQRDLVRALRSYRQRERMGHPWDLLVASMVRAIWAEWQLAKRTAAAEAEAAPPLAEACPEAERYRAALEEIATMPGVGQAGGIARAALGAPGGPGAA